MISCFSYANDFEVDGLCYRIIGNDQVEVMGLVDPNYSGALMIPETVNHTSIVYNVTSIGNNAFYQCSSLTGPLSIPNSVTSIGASAFSGCTGLTGSLTIPNSVISIGAYAFYNCKGFTGELTISNSLSTIEEWTFCSCSGLTGTLIIPNSVTTIEDRAFERCSGFSGSLIIPNSVTTIGNSAFAGCNGFNGTLTLSNSIVSIGVNVFYSCGFTGSLTIPNSVISIEDAAFCECSGFAGSLSIPNSVTSIGDAAFYGCIGFKGSLTIPNSVTSIGKQAFSVCNGFDYVYSNIETPFSIGLGAFSLISPNAILYVPKGKRSSYQQYPEWTKNFKYVLEEGESIPSNTYSLSITAIGNGFVSYGDETIRGATESFAVNEGTSISVFFNPDSGYNIKSLKVNGSYVTVNNSYFTTITSDTSIEVEFEAIPITTYTLSIKAVGNGSASYGGENIREATKSFTINEGTGVTVSFNPDTGYRIKSLKVNNSSVTASNIYNLTINSNTTIEVEFEAIPATTYTLSITATGNGSASYNGTSIRGVTKSFTVNEGTSATISFAPDNGYRIKSLKVNGTSVTASTSYTVKVNSNTTVAVEFEAIPQTTYSLSIKATGDGTASYGGITIINRTTTFTIYEGTSVTITFEPNKGYRIKSVKVNSKDVTSKLSNNSYTMSVTSDTSVEVEFEATPQDPDTPKTYTLSIRAKGNGIATYNGETIRATTKTYTLKEGTKVTMSFTPDEGNQIKSLMVDGSAISITTSYDFTMNSDKAIEVVFEETIIETNITIDGMNYEILSHDNHTLKLVSGDFDYTLIVPNKIEYQDEDWTVTGIDDTLLDGHEDLAAIIWELEMPFTINVKNSNLLLYVKDGQYAPATIKNVVVNGYANSITLTDAPSGNNFYCPRAFTVKSISYSHRYWMKTGINESRGWETIALPFDVQKISHSTKGEIIPFANWQDGNSMYPFWLFHLSTNGFIEADAIKANTPYIISMPNNDRYSTEYHLNGRVDFTAKNVEVKKSDDIHTSAFSDRTFIPNFVEQQAHAGLYALNVNNEYEVYQGEEAEGSKFVLNLRQIHPFEAYMTSSANTRSIGIFDGMTTDIRGIEIVANEQTLKVYDLSGKLYKVGTSLEDMKQELPAGVYIVNRQKMIIK